MKTIISIIFLCSCLPVNAYESVEDRINIQAYESQKGYAYENNCFRYEYREYYFPGNSQSRGYVKSYNEKVSVPCYEHGSLPNHSHYESNPRDSYANYKTTPKCNTSTTLGGLVGGGIAASLSQKDAYGWTIPLGVVLGASIGNAECK